MNIFSWNVNGIRAVHRKGNLDDFLSSYAPDVFLMQEIKGKIDKFPEEITNEKEYKKFFHSAEKAGYSGVAIFINKKYENEIEDFQVGMPGFEDTEGRIARIDLKNKLSIFSIYVPNGGKSEEAYVGKLSFFSDLTKHLNDLTKEGRKVLVGGDLNVARSDIDLADPDKHRNNVCFREEVKDKMEGLLSSGFKDTFREANPSLKGAYTYWDNFDFSIPRGVTPRDINKGWRLDYFLAHENLETEKPNILNEVRGSDHCPIYIEVN